MCPIKPALERHANVNFILSHGGGVIPFVAWRLSIAPMISALVPQWSQEKIFEYLGRFWYDTALCANQRSLASLMEVANPDRVVFGTDWPYAPATVTRLSIAGLQDAPAISGQLHRRVERENALALFPRFRREGTSHD